MSYKWLLLLAFLALLWSQQRWVSFCGKNIVTWTTLHALSLFLCFWWLQVIPKFVFRVGKSRLGSGWLVVAAFVVVFGILFGPFLFALPSATSNNHPDGWGQCSGSRASWYPLFSPFSMLPFILFLMNHGYCNGCMGFSWLIFAIIFCGGFSFLPAPGWLWHLLQDPLHGFLIPPSFWSVVLCSCQLPEDLWLAWFGFLHQGSWCQARAICAVLPGWLWPWNACLLALNQHYHLFGLLVFFAKFLAFSNSPIFGRSLLW